jgi:MSHA biogenesis protein MshJ
MKALIARWKSLDSRYVALSRRERLLLAAALVLGPLFIANTLLLDPLAARKRNLTTSLASQQSLVGDVQVQLITLQHQSKQDPDAAKRQEQATLQAAQGALDAQIRAFADSLVHPAEMNALLEGLLARQTGLRLLGFKTLAPQSILPAPPAKEPGSVRKSPSFDLYRHGVELRIEGTYAELSTYLTHLEKLPSRLLWGQLDYQVIDYPRAEMRLTVYTLSNESTWLRL